MKPGDDGEEPGGDGVDELGADARSLASAPEMMSIAESDSRAAPSMNISN